MPNLQENAAARCVHRVGGGAPSVDLRVVMNAGRADERAIVGDRHGRLGNDQARACPLRVVGGHEFAGNIARFATRAGERRHDDAVRQLEGTDGDW